MTRDADLEAIHRVLLDILGLVCPARPPVYLDPATPIEVVPDLDSLRLMETIALLEEHFAVTVDTDGLAALADLGDISALVLEARLGR